MTGLEEFYWTLRRLWTSVQGIMVSNQLPQLIIFLALHLISTHHTGTMSIVTHFMDHCLVLLNVAGMTVIYHHLFQTKKIVFK